MDSAFAEQFKLAVVLGLAGVAADVSPSNVTVDSIAVVTSTRSASAGRRRRQQACVSDANWFDANGNLCASYSDVALGENGLSMCDLAPNLAVDGVVALEACCEQCPPRVVVVTVLTISYTVALDAAITRAAVDAAQASGIVVEIGGESYSSSAVGEDTSWLTDIIRIDCR
eukprot:SAG22_NODE_2312_length_2732_cov_1.581846_3_plen_171_part_00